MNSDPYFSVIIPTYNRADFIRKTLDSVLAQDLADFEIIVVDDGSTDETQDVVQSYQDHRLRYVRKKNEERAAARNTGISTAKGKYITFLDSDDIAYPHHLATALGFLTTHHSPEVFHVGYEIISREGIVLKKINQLENINKVIIRGNPLSCAGVFVRRDIMQQNLFNEDRDLSGLEDWELWLRIGAGHTFLACHAITSAMVQHEHRSVMESDPVKLVRKMEKFTHYISSDPNNQQAYGRKLMQSAASAATYTALHLALTKTNKRMAWHYLKTGITGNPLEVFRKRFFIIVKLMLWR